MSGLADYEKQGLFDLFKNQEDKTILIQLARTLTKNYLLAESLEEALNIVFLHGGSTTTILNKKILTKEILFKYLHKNSLSAPNDFTKTNLVELIQNFWKDKFSDLTVRQSIEAGENYTTDYEINQQPNTVLSQWSNVSHLQQQSSVISLSSQQGHINEHNRTSNIIDATSYPINLLAKKFSEWFFKSYNENSIKSDDFWIDSTLQLKMIETNIDNIEERLCNSSLEAVETLMQIKGTYNFCFNPNLTHEGVQGRLDVHGLVLVLCCGTLHITDRCIGTFEALFGLIRDPNSENNWKIKNMKLILKSSAVIKQIPNLSNSDTLSEILSLPEPPGNI